MENHQMGLVFDCPIYIVERDERNRPTIAVLLDPKTNRIERMFVDLVYDLPLWVHHRHPDAVRVAPKLFSQECAKLAESENLVEGPRTFTISPKNRESIHESRQSAILF